MSPILVDLVVLAATVGIGPLVVVGLCLVAESRHDARRRQRRSR